MGSFTPLVFFTFGGMGGVATTAYKRLVSLLAAKRDHSYSSVASWVRCSTSFSLLRSDVTCLRGARSHHDSPVEHLTLQYPRVRCFHHVYFELLFFFSI